MNDRPFPILDVSHWVVVEPEQMGKKAKVWLDDEAGDRWLFKQVRADEQGVRGEDWAEKVVAEIGALLQVPVARVELANRAFLEGASRGIVSRSIVGEDDSLQHGNELLAAGLPSYPASKAGEVPGYTVEAVIDVLRPYPSIPGSLHATAVEQFVGYLVLDALVSNTDRHHENWAVVRRSDGGVHLAPSFDHASSLGFQESPKRKEWLLGTGIGTWVRRGKTKFEGQPNPVDVAHRGLDLLPASGKQHWRERVTSLRLVDVEHTIGRVSAAVMSQVDRTFALGVVRENRRRLLDEN